MSNDFYIVDPGIVSGVPVFAGTRVPLKALFDYIADGDTVDAFLADFPGVTLEQVQQCLDRASASFGDTDEAAA